MRRVILSGTFALLLVALYFLWQHRFERLPELSTCHLADLRAASHLPSGADWSGAASQLKLGLRADPGRSGAAVRVNLPINRPVDYLHLRFQASAKDLKPGGQFWEDGRCLIEWHSPGDKSKWENDPFYSAQDNQSSGVAEVVMRPDKSPAIPALRIENLGISGDFELSIFEATVLRERVVWKIGRWFLLAGWLAWVVAWVGTSSKSGFIRALFAASIWLLMVVYCVIPGPWDDVRSLFVPFQIGPKMTTSRITTTPAAGAEATIQDSVHSEAGIVKSVGQIPTKGDFTLRLKLYAQKARPLLHVLLLFAPTLLIACLVGRQSATSLSIILSLAIEAAQVAFGFGFDWVDVFDLSSDAVGIMLALWAYARLNRSRQARYAWIKSF